MAKAVQLLKTMAIVTEAAVLESLKGVHDPDLTRDIVSLKFIKNIRIDQGRVSFTIEQATFAGPGRDRVRDEARLRQLLSRLRARGMGTFRLPKVHPAEISKECLETLGFRPSGGHLLYAARARSE